MDTISKSNDESYKYKEILKGFRPPFYYETFTEFYNKCGFKQNDVCLIVERNKKTIIKWETSGAPQWAYLLLYSAGGYMLSQAFHGFMIKDNVLITGTRITRNYGFTAGEIINFSFEKERFEVNRLKMMEIERQLAEYQSERPSLLGVSGGFTG